MNLNKAYTALRRLPEATLDRQTVLSGKHKLLAEINRRQEARAARVLSWADAFRFMWLRTVRKSIPSERYVIAGFLLIAVTTSTTYMAQAAVPGDVLWPVKLTYEKAELAFATDPAHEGRLHIKHVDNRLKELTVIVAQPNTVEKSKSISQLVRRLEKDITAADQSLKLAKQEKQDTEPQVIMALAQDLNEKALEAAVVLEDNHEKLEEHAEDVMLGTSEEIGILATTTEEITDSSGDQGSSTSTSTDPSADAASSTTAASEAAKVVAEVQAINVEVSYSALKAMVELLEPASIPLNREEVKRLMVAKTSQLQAEFAPLPDQIALIDDDFILHRTELRSLMKKATEATALATDLAKLDNLSGSYRKLIEAKDAVQRMTRLLEEVRLGDGFRIKPEVQIQKGSIIKPVKMQTVEGDAAEPRDPVVTE